MPLVIHLRKSQRAIINGAVIENVSGRTVSIALKNEAKLLRSNDVLDPEAVVTPAARTYFALQCAYLFPDKTSEHLSTFHGYLVDFLSATPSAAPIAARILDAIEAGNLYAALKAAQALIQHEGKVLSHDQATDPAELQRATGARQSAPDGGLGADPGRLTDEDRARSE
ncbi:MAG: flagellum biosynthesis protein FlbT [Rhodospirillales bacterium]|nr:flagellum biosynthesis protein FlbT [Rhodospirillales bacterium]